jgi:hypothetical protein
MRSTCPPHCPSLILPAIFWGQNYVPVPPYALIFFWFFFSIVFGSFFIILFPFYSPFQFLLILLFLSLPILLVGAILRLLFLLLLYLELFVDLQTCILMICTHIRHSEGFFEGANPVLSSYSSLPVLCSSSSYSSLLIFKLFVLLQTCILNTKWAEAHK